jgi:hypothetical protein
MEALVAGTDRKTNMSAEEDQKTEERARSAGLSVPSSSAAHRGHIILNTNLFYTGTTAVQVGDVSYNTAQFSYYYKTQYYNFVQNYGSYASMFGLDTSKPLKDQTCSMLQRRRHLVRLLQAADPPVHGADHRPVGVCQEEQHHPDDTEKANIDTEMQTYASQRHLRQQLFLHQELSHIALFGRGCSEELVRGELERYALAYKAYTTVPTPTSSRMRSLEDLLSGRTRTASILFDYDLLSGAGRKVATAAATDVSTDTTATNTTATDTTASSAVTKETMAAAKAKADKIAAAIKSGKDFAPGCRFARLW